MIYAGKERILLSRLGAMGDVLDVTPIVARLRRELGPDPIIEVETHHRQIFANNPDCVAVPYRHGAYTKIFNLNGAQEQHLRNVPGVTCYSREVFGDDATPANLSLVYPPEPGVVGMRGVDWSRAIVFHPARSWPQRTLPRSFWVSFAEHITRLGWLGVAIGTYQDWHDLNDDIQGERILDTISWYPVSGPTLSLAQQASIIAKAQAFVCSDSGMMAVAQCTPTPVLALLTMTLPFLAIRRRNGVDGFKFFSMMANVECCGCTHRQTDVVTYFQCPRDDLQANLCVRSFNPENVARMAHMIASHERNHRQLIPKF